MTAVNVSVSVADPDALLEGTSEYAPFVATRIKVYRYTTEAIARADTTGAGGTLVDGGSGYTFEVIASTEQETQEAGPWRYGIYDSGQLSTSWYRYHFTDTAQVQLSVLSRPWRSAQRSAWALRDVIAEVGEAGGHDSFTGTIDAGASDSTSLVTCVSRFKSTVVDSRYHQNSHLLITEADATAPEGEEAIIASVATGTGIATLDHPLTTSIQVGDGFFVDPIVSPAQIRRAINTVRERMFMVVTHDIAVHHNQSRYPVPHGVVSRDDVINLFELTKYKDLPEKESTYDGIFLIESNGYENWITFPGGEPPAGPLVRLQYLMSYRDYEGDLSAMTDVTRAPITWLRKAAAWEVYTWLATVDRTMPTFREMAGVTEEETAKLSGRFAPNVTRRLNTGRRERIGPVSV